MLTVAALMLLHNLSQILLVSFNTNLFEKTNESFFPSLLSKKKTGIWMIYLQLVQRICQLSTLNLDPYPGVISKRTIKAVGLILAGIKKIGIRSFKKRKMPKHMLKILLDLESMNEN